MSCLICDRIEMIKNNTNPYFVKELETGYVVIGDYQYFKGYTLFLCKEHLTELHFLDKSFRLKYLEEMAMVAEAVYNVFKPDKLNYELLGNEDSHMHWHLFPRIKGDTPVNGPIWILPKEEITNDIARPTNVELKNMVNLLKKELDKHIN